MATKSQSRATRKPSTGAGRTSAGAKSAANPFKKTADAIKKSQTTAQRTTAEFAKRSTAAASEAAKDAFGYGQQFTQATDWFRNSSEAAQNIFAQAFQSVPSFGTTGFGANGATPSFPVDTQSFSRAAETANRSVAEIISLGSEQLQTISETNTALANMAKDLSQEVVQSANSLFNDQVELSKAMFQCRNVDDVLELQGKASQAALDNFFNETQRLSELTLKYASDIAEPIQQRFAHLGERLTKIAS